MKRRGLLVVVSSPSGGGKGTILKELFRRNENLKMSVSATTRAPRPGEEHGVHYYFITKDEFKTNIENHAMLEYAEYCDNFYGTPKAPVEKWLEEGHDVVLEIEVQGGRQIKKVAPDCVSLFILPPSLKVLEKRLRGRGTETEEVIEKRLAAAADEIRCVKDYDYAVINDTVEQAVLDIEAACFPRKRYSRKDPEPCLNRPVTSLKPRTRAIIPLSSPLQSAQEKLHRKRKTTMKSSLKSRLIWPCRTSSMRSIRSSSRTRLTANLP